MTEKHEKEVIRERNPTRYEEGIHVCKVVDVVVCEDVDGGGL